MANQNFNLERFLKAQEEMYPIALQELHNGKKLSHWMWYIFPQLKHLGRSRLSNFYGIKGPDEARAFLDHPTLSLRLREVCQAILGLPTSNAAEVLGGIDAQKLRSSMTLFDAASPNDIFALVLAKYFSAKGDTLTLHHLNPKP